MRRFIALFAALLCAAVLLAPTIGIAEEGDDEGYAEDVYEEVSAEDEAASTESYEDAVDASDSTDETTVDDGSSVESEASSDVSDAETDETWGEYVPRTVQTESTAAADGSKPELFEARAACVMDDNGNVLYELNGDVEMDMASITKIMAAMVALDSGVPLDKEFAFVVDEYNDDAQLVGFTNGQMLTLADLLRVSLIFSGNDAATNVAYAVAGSEEEFVKLMNEKAKELGLEHTHFTNPHGLREEGHYSCVTDLCKMGRYALDHYPFILETVRTRSIDVVLGEALFTLYSTDTLMEYYEGLRGIKTGREATGWSFLGCARRDNVTLYSCVLCCDTDQGRFDDSASLLDWGFSCYEKRELCRSDWTLRSVSWEDGFWLKCPVQPTRNAGGKSFKGKGIDYKTVMLKPNVLAKGQGAYGSTVWSQEGRTVGSTSYRTGKPMAHVPAWNAFVAPLFEDDE